MVVQFIDGKFRTIDNSGYPAVGWKVWAFASPDTSTPAPTYSDVECTVLNTWPVVLDARGESFIYVNTATDFYLTIPTATDISAPVWESRKVGEQQQNPVIGEATPITLNNNYVVTTTPAVLSLYNNFQLTMTPDMDNVDTIGTNTFTGSGANDLTASGPYLGTTAGSIFTIKVDTGVIEAPTACTGALASLGAGLLSNGVYSYKITYVSGLGESDIGAISNAVTVSDYSTNGKINLTNIPISPIVNVTARKIYRTKANGSIYYLIDTISDNTTVIYTDNIADSALDTVPPTPYTPPACITALAGVGAGLLTNGVYLYKITFATISGESAPGTASDPVTVADYTANGKIALTSIPIAAQTVVTSRKVYRTKADGSIYYYVATISDNSTTIFTDNIPDSALTILASDSSSLPDTVSWKKDGGVWHPGVVITGAAQILMEGFTITFATTTGHVLGDLWSIVVMTPARVALDVSDNLIVYKNKGGSIVAIDGHDMIAGYPAQMVMNEAISGWLLINPATPIFSTTTISALRYRKIITSDYNLLLDDQGRELSCIGTLTLTLLPGPQFANRFFYVGNTGTGLVTVDAGTNYKIYGFGTRYFYIGPGARFQFETNGVDWNVMTSLGYPMLVSQQDVSGVGVVTFTGLIPGFRYRMISEVVKTATEPLYLKFNDDSGSNYDGLYHYTRVGSSDVFTASSSTTVIVTGNIDNATFTRGEIDFQTYDGDNMKVSVYGHTSFIATTFCGGHIHYNYSGAADLNSVALWMDSGSIAGRVSLYQVG